MTISALGIDDVRASVDLALEELHNSLRKVNHEVSGYFPQLRTGLVFKETAYQPRFKGTQYLTGDRSLDLVEP